MPLAPKLVMAETRGVYAGPVTVTVLIPAHNEESLHLRDPRLAAVAVAAAGAGRRGGRQLHRRDRPARPRGRASTSSRRSTTRTRRPAASTRRCAQVLPGQGDNDCVMVMDADTTLDAGFLEGAARRLTDDRALMAVGGLFYGEDGAGLIGQFQRNEYTRYQRDLRRRRGPRLRAHRHRVGVPAAGAARRGRRARPQPARRPGRRLRHRRPHRGQRAHHRAQVARRPDDLAERVHGRHRGDADLAGPVGPAPALAARRAGEPRCLRPATRRRSATGPSSSASATASSRWRPTSC